MPKNSDRPEEADETTALLIRARALVARGWCRGTEARNLLGLRVSPYSRWATRWCMGGAMVAAQLTASDLDYQRAANRLCAAIGGGDAPIFNDTQETVEPVLAAFDRAIAASQEATQ